MEIAMPARPYLTFRESLVGFCCILLMIFFPPKLDKVFTFWLKSGNSNI